MLWGDSKLIDRLVFNCVVTESLASVFGRHIWVIKDKGISFPLTGYGPTTLSGIPGIYGQDTGKGP
jgi:hypothetical protein